MNKKEMTIALHSATGYPIRMIDVLLDAFTAQIKEVLTKGESYSLEGIGKIEVTYRKPRRGRNPQTGKIDMFPAVYSPKMTFTKTIKNEINSRDVG